MGLILHEEAKRERFNAIAWYEEDYPGRGRRFFDAVKGGARAALEQFESVALDLGEAAME